MDTAGNFLSTDTIMTEIRSIFDGCARLEAGIKELSIEMQAPDGKRLEQHMQDVLTRRRARKLRWYAKLLENEGFIKDFHVFTTRTGIYVPHKYDLDNDESSVLNDRRIVCLRRLYLDEENAKDQDSIIRRMWQRLHKTRRSCGIHAKFEPRSILDLLLLFTTLSYPKFSKSKKGQRWESAYDAVIKRDPRLEGWDDQLLFLDRAYDRGGATLDKRKR